MPPKLKGFEFYEKTLKSAKHVVAPMVDASELAWRMLGRSYDCHLAYTPMLHAATYVRDARYRRDNLQTCAEDRPLIVQFCANDVDIFAKAVQLTMEEFVCDAIDLNLGCPQMIARRGHFGSFLQDEWQLLTKMIRTVHDQFEIPVTCKVRVFESIEKTVAYAKMLQAAGAQLLTVHGRTREQKGPLTGIASWSHIQAVREAVSIPVFANGNIQSLDDVRRCIQETGVQGVMSAEGHLTNPALFAGINPPVWKVIIEYLDLVERYPCPMSYVRGHVFKIAHHLLQIRQNFDLREVVAKAMDLQEFRDVAIKLKDRYQDYLEGSKVWETPEELSRHIMSQPPWLCQPYVRPPPEEYIKKMEDLATAAELKRRTDEPANPTGLSKKKLKKLERKSKPRQLPQCQINGIICAQCPNPGGLKCDFKLCKTCCRSKCYADELDCTGHKILVKTKRETARSFEHQQVAVVS